MGSWSVRSSRVRLIPKQQCRRSRRFRGATVLAKVKFCGMTRPQDAALAAEIGASYVGVVFADGPRRVDAANGCRILDAAGSGVKRVGVFGTNDPQEITRSAEVARLDVVQLHADPSTSDVKALRGKIGGEIPGTRSFSLTAQMRSCSMRAARNALAVLDRRSRGATSRSILRATGAGPRSCSLADSILRMYSRLFVLSDPMSSTSPPGSRDHPESRIPG
jgi:hypothetical protein